MYFLSLRQMAHWHLPFLPSVLLPHHFMQGKQKAYTCGDNVPNATSTKPCPTLLMQFNHRPSFPFSHMQYANLPIKPHHAGVGSHCTPTTNANQWGPAWQQHCNFLTNWWVVSDKRLSTLLCLLCLHLEQELVAACPIYQAFANVKVLSMVALNNAIISELAWCNNPYLCITLSPAAFHNFLSLQWHHIYPDLLTTIFFGNLFLFGSTDEEHQHPLDLQLALVESSNNFISNANILKSTS